MEYSALKVKNIAFILPTNMCSSILERAKEKHAAEQTEAGRFAIKLSIETLLNFSESLEMSNKLYVAGYLNKSIAYYEGTSFEGFMNYYHGLKVGGLV